MSDEATVNSGLNARFPSGKLDYQSRPTTFRADMSTDAGPAPGRVTVSTAGSDVNLSAITTPGLCRMINLDSTNYVQVGLYDPETVKFYPMLEIMPGESYVLRISRDIKEEYGTGAGTGTTGASTNTLRMKAIGGACECLVEIFEK